MCWDHFRDWIAGPECSGYRTGRMLFGGGRMKRSPEMGYWGGRHALEELLTPWTEWQRHVGASEESSVSAAETNRSHLSVHLSEDEGSFHSTSLHPGSLTPKQDWGQGVCSPLYKCLGRSPTGVYIYPKILGCVEAPAWVYSKPRPQVANQHAPPLELPQSRLHPLGALLHP